jgi:signal transduction histidine kinase/ligand-binding sensor domain-containing protein
MQRTFATTLISCLVGLAGLAGRTDAQFRFDSWTTDNGLPQASVNSIVQTRDGFLWLTTYGGLVRYDGLRFQVFNTGNTKGLRTSRFVWALEDNDGSLWITTEGQGITRYKDGRFTTYTTENGLPDNQIQNGEKRSDGSLVFHVGGKPYRWNGEAFVPLPRQADEPDRVFFRTQSGGLWYFNDSRLRKVENDRLVVDYPFAFQVKRLFEDSQGRAWIAADSDFLFMLKDGRFTVYTEKEGYVKHRFGLVFEDRQKRVWFGTPDGLVLFKDNKFTQFTAADGLTRGGVNAMFQDHEGTLWVSTAGGLNRLTERVINTYSVPEGLAAENVYPIYQDRLGKIWIGSWRGLTVYADGKFQNVTERYLLADEPISALSEDREGNIWIGTWSGHIARVSNGQASLFTQIPMLGLRVRVIHQDRSGSFWLGTGNGLIKAELSHVGGLQPITRYATENGLSGTEVFAIHEDRSGQLWIGTVAGLTKYRDGAFQAFTEKDGIDANIVRTIYEDKDGTLWIGMYDSGLYRFKEGRFTHYTTNEGLFDNGVFQILEDDRGNFWISCNLGIYRVKKSELNDLAEGRIQKTTSILYNKHDGMLNSECNGGVQPAGIKASDGKLWFPTQQGVAVINPETVPSNPRPPPVVIESLVVDTVVVEALSPMKIRPGQVYFEIHYSGLSFINPELVKFKYRLEGLDAEWIDAGTRRTAYYSHLPPGNYRFTVLAANRDAVWNNHGASIEIIVLPPFWRTWWFVTFAFLALGGFALAVYRHRVGILKRAHATQEAFSRQLIESQEEERRRIAIELHDSLGQSLVLIRNWALLGLKASDEQAPARGNLNEISTTASEAISEVREIAYNLGPYQLDRLGLSKTIEEMVQKVSNSSPVMFNVEIDELDGVFSRQAEISIFRIVQEAINNVVKHSRATEARISVKRDSAYLALTIQDDGRGFPTEEYSTNGADRRRGLGLMGMFERVRILSGDWAIDSAPGLGTTIRVRIACRNHLR